MSVKKTVIKVEDGEGEVQADKGQDSKEAAGAGREQCRHPNEGATAAAMRYVPKIFGRLMQRHRSSFFERWI